jgi:hypothetical protein
MINERFECWFNIILLHTARYLLVVYHLGVTELQSADLGSET